MRAADIMTANPITVRPDSSVMEAVRVMLQRRFSGLPVVDGSGVVVGIVTEGDLLRRGETGTQRRRPRWIEFFVGPRLGLWIMSAEYQPPFDGMTEHQRGWTLGANAGLMLRTRVGLSLGVMVDFHTREGSRSCVTAPGQPGSCLAGWRSTEDMLAISFAAASSPR